MVKILSILSLLVLTSCNCNLFLVNNNEVKSVTDAVNSYSLQKETVQKSLRFFTSSPHPMDSSRQIEVRDYLVAQLRSLNVESRVQSFSVETPNKNAGSVLTPLTLTKKGHNVLARLNLVENPKCLIGLASHYDTKELEGFPYVGANDSGSSSALILDLARFLLKNKDSLKLKCDVELIWFDGEESVLANWNDGLTHPARLQDNTYGSRSFVKDLEACSDTTKYVPFVALILLDMVGYENLKLSLDENSDTHLKSLLISATRFLKKKDLLGPSVPIQDDHLPFKEKGVPVLDIIDFNHLDHWHTPLDQFETVSLESLELSGKVSLYVLLHAAIDPEPLKKNASIPCLKAIQRGS